MSLKQLVLAAVLAGTALFAGAAPITYSISAEVSFVFGGEILGHAASAGDSLTGTAVFDADQSNPWGAVSFEINGNTFELLSGPAQYVRTNPGQYVLGYNIGGTNPGSAPQWRVSGADTLIAPGGSRAYFTLIFGESSSDAPTSPVFRSPDSADWDSFDIQMDFGTSGAVFANETIVATSVPAPATASLLLIALAALRRRA